VGATFVYYLFFTIWQFEFGLPGLEQRNSASGISTAEHQALMWLISQKKKYMISFCRWI
jgi:hypothetical protein